jgi:hypothetical protein
MNITHKDFIGVYENALEKTHCENIICEFENFYKTKPSETWVNNTQFSNGDLGRSDISFFVNLAIPKVANLINEVLNKCITVYADEFFPVKNIKAVSLQIKLQKTLPRGGFHVWHCESSTRENMERVLAWMVYLNDIPDGEGETEFLWQGIRVKPKAGTCIIWPAGFTHTHRGNPVYSCNKYVATGWYMYAT